MSQFRNIALLNGWASDDALWSAILPTLESLGSVILVPVNDALASIKTDLIGENNDKKREALCSQLCDDLLASLPEQTVLLGWSLGGMLATKMAARATQKKSKKIVGLITLGTNVRFVADQTWPTAMAAATFDQFCSVFEHSPTKALKRFALLEVHGDQHKVAQQAWLKKHSLVSAIDQEILAAGLTLLSHIDNRDALSALAYPSLHCFGERDALVPVSAAKEIEKKQPNSQIFLLPKRGHLLHYPASPLIEHLQTFLSKL